MANNYTLNFYLSFFVFVAHIIANLIVTKPNVELFTRLEKLTLFPPGWVFGIWFAIWTLQSILFYQTFSSEFWNNSITLLFILICIGNIGSQYAGANNLGWITYISFIVCMLISSILFMEQTSKSYKIFSILKLSTQLYVGWASLAFLVGTGVILVTEKQIISDKFYTIVGSIFLIIVPIVIWSSWFTKKLDYIIVSIPYFILYFAFALRLFLK